MKLKKHKCYLISLMAEQPLQTKRLLSLLHIKDPISPLKVSWLKKSCVRKKLKSGFMINQNKSLDGKITLKRLLSKSFDRKQTQKSHLPSYNSQISGHSLSRKISDSLFRPCLCLTSLLILLVSALKWLQKCLNLFLKMHIRTYKLLSHSNFWLEVTLKKNTEDFCYQ